MSPRQYVRINRQHGHFNKDGYHYITVNGIRKSAHIYVAEKVLNRPFKNNECVHHIDENKLNNKNSNLLICTKNYHNMLHKRMRAIKASGNPNWIKCVHCGKHDDPKNMYINKNNRWHSDCHNSYMRGRKNG